MGVLCTSIFCFNGTCCGHCVQQRHCCTPVTLSLGAVEAVGIMRQLFLLFPAMVGTRSLLSRALDGTSSGCFIPQHRHNCGGSWDVSMGAMPGCTFGGTGTAAEGGEKGGGTGKMKILLDVFYCRTIPSGAKGHPSLTQIHGGEGCSQHLRHFFLVPSSISGTSISIFLGALERGRTPWFLH